MMQTGLFLIYALKQNLFLYVGKNIYQLFAFYQMFIK